MGAVRKEKTVEDTVCEIHKFGLCRSEQMLCQIN